VKKAAEAVKLLKKAGGDSREKISPLGRQLPGLRKDQSPSQERSREESKGNILTYGNIKKKGQGGLSCAKEQSSPGKLVVKGKNRERRLSRAVL